MRYWIRILNKQPLGVGSPEAIRPALENLEVINGKNRTSPFFVVRYQPWPHPPLVVYQWPAAEMVGQRLFQFEGSLHEQVNGQLGKAVTIFEIELQASQLHDMGLLIGYELARWIAFGGDGIVYGLDGHWYRLNHHKAFIALGQG